MQRRTPMIYLGIGDNGRHFAASSASPYFYFEAVSEDDVMLKARAAIRFYDRCREREPSPITEVGTVAVAGLRPSKILEWEALA
jgi:hypothetical protein